jgi:acetyl-CoA carboxylase carboxyltransferase component
MFLTGPDVMQAVTGEQVTAHDLGGADVHTGRSGVAHLVADPKPRAWRWPSCCCRYLPQNNNEDPPPITPDDPPTAWTPALNSLIPEQREPSPTTCATPSWRVFDRDSFLESRPLTRPMRVIGFARLDGYSVGVVANQPACMAGALNIDASDKISRFIRCLRRLQRAHHHLRRLPRLPARRTDQEYGGVIRHGAKIIYAYCEATVPKISHRHAQGHGRCLRGHGLQADAHRPGLCLAHGADRRDGRRTRGQGAVPPRREATPPTPRRANVSWWQQYRERFFNPYRAADVGQIDEVIEPHETRPRLVRALELLRTKVQQNPPKKHGLIPS